MGQVLHGSATTTEAVRRAIRRSEASVRALALRHGISPTNVQKWRRRDTTADAAMGPGQARSTVLSAKQEAVPCRIHTVLTDNGVQFAHTGPEDCIGDGTQAPWIARQQARTGRVHAFGDACEKHGIEHRLTRPCHPWTNGQVERMNRTLKDATVRRYHDGSHDDLRRHLQLFLDAYNHARRLKALRGLTPCEFTGQIWTREPDRFRIDPSHHTPGLNT